MQKWRDTYESEKLESEDSIQSTLSLSSNIDSEEKNKVGIGYEKDEDWGAMAGELGESELDTNSGN